MTCYKCFKVPIAFADVTYMSQIFLTTEHNLLISLSKEASYLLVPEKKIEESGCGSICSKEGPVQEACIFSGDEEQPLLNLE